MKSAAKKPATKAAVRHKTPARAAVRPPAKLVTSRTAKAAKQAKPAPKHVTNHSPVRLPLSPPRPGVWFAPVRWSYLPVAWQGWILYFPYIAYLMITYIVVDRHNAALVDKIIGVIPFWVAGAAIMQWLASHRSA